MRYRFHHIEEAPRSAVEEHVRSKADLLESRLATFQDDLVTLDVRLDHREKRYGDHRNLSSFTNRLVLDLPGRKLPNIRATGTGETWQIAVNDAFDALETQLDRTLASLHRETAIHDFQHRPSWERPGAEKLGKPQVSPVEDEESWMEEWDKVEGE